MNALTLFADRHCLTLLHSLWQATAILVLVAIVVKLSRCGSRAGYAAWMAVLAFAIFCMPVTFSRFHRDSSRSRLLLPSCRSRRIGCTRATEVAATYQVDHSLGSCVDRGQISACC